MHNTLHSFKRAAALLLLHSCIHHEGPLAMQGDSKHQAPAQPGSVALRHTPAPLATLQAASPQAMLTTVVRENHGATQRQGELLEEMRDNRVKEIDTLLGGIRKIHLGQGKLKKGIVAGVEQALANLKTDFAAITAGQGAEQTQAFKGLSERFEKLIGTLPREVATKSDIEALLQTVRSQAQAAQQRRSNSGRMTRRVIEKITTTEEYSSISPRKVSQRNSEPRPAPSKGMHFTPQRDRKAHREKERKRLEETKWGSGGAHLSLSIKLCK